MEFNKEELLRKYKEICNTHTEIFKPDFTNGEYTVYYARIPDPCLSSDLSSHRILQHINVAKALFPRLYKKLPKGAIAESYATMHFDKDGKLHHLEQSINSCRKYVTICISDQLQADYVVNIYSGGESDVSIELLDMEWAEYDSDGNPVSVESFRGDGTLNYGVTINCEYYQYENGKLVHADQFKDYCTGVRLEESMVRQFVPDRIMNPEIFAYDFERTDDGVLCMKTNYYSKSKTFTQSINMPEKEIKKMEEHGIRCFH